jgi:hypothetical protein
MLFHSRAIVAIPPQTRPIHGAVGVIDVFFCCPETFFLRPRQFSVNFTKCLTYQNENEALRNNGNASGR